MAKKSAPNGDALASYREVMRGARDNQQVYARKWRRWEKVRAGDVSSGTRSNLRAEQAWRSQLRFKFAWQQLKTLEPRLIKGELSCECTPILKPGDDVDASMGAALSIQKAVAEQFFWDRFAEKEARLVNHLLELGCYWTKTTWDDETILYRELNPESGQLEPVFRNAPTTSPLHPGFIFADPAARVLDEAGFITHRSFKTAKQVDAWLKTRGLEKLADKLPTPGTTSGSDADWLASNAETPEEEKARRGGKMVLDEYWDFVERRVSWVLNGSICLDSKPIPTKFLLNPFVNFVTQIDPNSLYGVSEVFALDDPQAEYQTMQNLVMDGTKLRVNPPLAVRVGSGAEDYMGIPGRKTDVEGNLSDAIRPIQHDLDLSMARESLDKLKADGEYMTGINESMAGQDQSATATGSTLNSQASGNRVNLRSSLLDQSWARVFENAILLNRQCAEVDGLMMSREGRVLDVSRQVFATPVMVRPEMMSQKQAQALKLNNAQLAINTLLPAASGMPVFADGSALTIEPGVKLLAEALSIDVDKFKTAPPPPPPDPNAPPQDPNAAPVDPNMPPGMPPMPPGVPA